MLHHAELAARTFQKFGMQYCEILCCSGLAHNISIQRIAKEGSNGYDSL